MKKVLFLMFLLLLMGLGAAGVKAQVRIGGNGTPNPAAVLDLNVDDTNSGTKGLALPRVSLANVSTPLTGTPVVSGMMVYNTNTTTTGGRGVGIYYWVVDSSKWIKVSDGSFVATNVIDSTNIKKSGIAAWNLSSMGADSSAVLTFDGHKWVTSYPIVVKNQLYTLTGNWLPSTGLFFVSTAVYDGLCSMEYPGAQEITLGRVAGKTGFLWNGSPNTVAAGTTLTLRCVGSHL